MNRHGVLQSQSDTPLVSHQSVLFVLPVYPSRSESVNPFWFTAMGLTTALRKHFATVDILLPTGIFTGDDSSQGLSTGCGTPVVRRLPQTTRVFLGDLRAAGRAQGLHRIGRSLRHRRFDIVIQLHRRFVDWGSKAAAALDAPFVLKVEALETREEARWGVRRPGWGRFAESIGEVKIFRRADLLLPISTEVDNQLAEVGVPRHKRHIVQSGVDPDVFSPGPPDDHLVRTYRMEQQHRIGWVGGFRPFHGLGLLPALADEIHRRLPHAVLYMIGTGPKRHSLEHEMANRDWVRFVGVVRHSDVPRWIRCFDAAIVTAESGPFHYSPLKLYEYLACGTPVAAADVGDIGRDLVNGRDALLVPAGDPVALAGAVSSLVSNPALRNRVSHAARRRAVADFSWDVRAASIVRALRDRSLL
jgi:glycosyltransferase involved in cell wall biosynthesis